MSGPTRRSTLLALGAATALPAVAQSGTSPAAMAPASPAGDLRFLTAADAAFIAAAADRFIPADEFPSASQAGAVTYIDRQLTGPFGKGERLYLAGPVVAGTPEQGYQLGLTPAQVYRESLDVLTSDPRGRDFHRGSPEQQDAFLKELEAGRWMLGPVPSSIFFETLLSNVIESYFADPLYGGNRDMVGWRMIGFPGAYAHYAQWVGRHNVRFNRPPVAIVSQTSATGHSHGGGHDAQGRAPQDTRIPRSARPQGGS